MITRNVIIMPTINVAPNLKAWAAQLDPNLDMIIIAGNGISPHREIEQLLAETGIPSVYMHPEAEVSTKWHISDALDLNHHHRRSLALLEAMIHDPEVIITLDDDNYPMSDFWVTSVHRMLTTPNQNLMRIRSEAGWFDVGKLCQPRVMHRGFPHWLRNDEHLAAIVSEYGERVGVFAGLWIGDPDCDATERIILGTQIERVKNPYILDRGTWSPFNSQSTAFRGELAPLLLMWPGVGRFDDIFASYLARAYMDANDWYHAAGSPAVRHDRNAHDFVKDLEAELYGYKHSRRIIDVLREAGPETSGLTPTEGAHFLMSTVIAKCIDILPEQLTRAFSRWIMDVKEVVNR